MSEWLEQLAERAKERRNGGKMTVRLTVDVTVNEVLSESARSNDASERDWFYSELLGDPELLLHSNLIGETVGEVKVVRIHKTPDM